MLLRDSHGEFPIFESEAGVAANIDSSSGAAQRTVSLAISVLVLSAICLILLGCGLSAAGSHGAPAPDPVPSITIAPNGISLTSGATQQFTVTAKNISSTAITWSATAGTISREGLFTAPAVSTPATVTVKAASSNNENISGEAIVTVQPAAIQAPPAVYQSCTQATPDGLVTLQLPATLPFAGLTGSNTLVDDPEPQNGSPCLHNRMLRVTDAATEPAHPNFSFFAGGGGSADTNAWSSDSSLFVLQDSGGRTLVINFDPATMQIVPLYGQTAYNLTQLKVAYGSWAYTLPDALYAYASGGTVIEQITFANHALIGASGPNSVSTIGDFQGIDPQNKVCGNNGLAGITWQSDGEHSKDDQTFGAGFSTAGAQNSGIYAAAFRVGQGCTLLNTMTGQIVGDWGYTGLPTFIGSGCRTTPSGINPNNPICSAQFTVHNTKISKDGKLLIIAKGTCAGDCGGGPFAWQIGTANIYYADDFPTTQGGGHWTEGYTHFVNFPGNADPMEVAARSFLDSSTPNLLLTQPCSPALTTNCYGDGMKDNATDSHWGWSNADALDTTPFCGTTTAPYVTFPGPWFNEVLCVSPVDGTVWRMAHTYADSGSQLFSTANAIGAISQDGKWYLLSSDMMGTLGSTSGASTCTAGKDCRGDVFVISLQ